MGELAIRKLDFFGGPLLEVPYSVKTAQSLCTQIIFINYVYIKIIHQMLQLEFREKTHYFRMFTKLLSFLSMHYYFSLCLRVF